MCKELKPWSSKGRALGHLQRLPGNAAPAAAALAGSRQRARAKKAVHLAEHPEAAQGKAACKTRKDSRLML